MFGQDLMTVKARERKREINRGNRDREICSSIFFGLGEGSREHLSHIRLDFFSLCSNYLPGNHCVPGNTVPSTPVLTV